MPFASSKNTASIDRMGSEKLLSRGETIFRKKTTAKYIYKVEIGCIRTFARNRNDRRLVVAFYFPGDYFGLEMRKQHDVSAEAVTPSKILIIKRKTLMSRAVTDVAVANKMLDLTNLELQRTYRHSLLLRNPASERVREFLVEMKNRNQSKQVILLMSRQDIADYLNLTIESVARALTQLKKASAISIRGIRHVTVHMRKPLAA